MSEQEDIFTGRYTRAFLNNKIGKGQFSVRSFPLDVLSTREGYTEAMACIDDDKLSLAYVSDTKLTCIWMHDYPGWLAFCEPLGIDISYSSKIAKRLTLITRLAYLYIFRAAGELNVAYVRSDEFTTYDAPKHVADKFLDGANVISTELLEEAITNGSAHIDEQFSAPCLADCEDDCKKHGRGNPWEKALVNRAIDRAGTFSFRWMTQQGLFKGDCIAVPSAQIGGYDMIVHDDPKPELKSRDFDFILLEPHPGIKRHEFSKDEPSPPPVWSDDQSISWLGEWLFPHEQLVRCLKDFAEMTYQDIEAGNYPRFFTDTSKRDEEHSTVTQFQGQALQWEAEGLGLEQSIFLQERIGQGAVNQLSKKRRWPIPCAIYVHVATDSWLHMAGYVDPETGEHPWPFEEAETPQGKIWYHKETGRLIYNDMDFASLYDRHGGWDLDDSVKAHYRRMGNRKVIVVVRSPNSMGEYDIKDYVEGTYFPTWTHADGSVMTFPEISTERPAYIEDLDISYKHKSLSPPRSKSSRYTKEQVKDALNMTRKFRGVFGRRANADIAYFATLHDYRRKQLAPIEAIVDACTQEQSEWALNLINADTEAVIDEIRQADVVVDRTLWRQRIKRMEAGINYGHLQWSQMAVVHDNLCDLYQRKFFDLAQRTIEHIDPEIFELGKLHATKGEKLVRWYYQLVHTLPRCEGETRTEFCHRVNARMCDVLQRLPDHALYNNVLAMARHVYSNQHGNEYKDTPIFQNGAYGEPSVFQYYLDALNFYGIGKQDWNATALCGECGDLKLYTERAKYQIHLTREVCENC